MADSETTKTEKPLRGRNVVLRDKCSDDAQRDYQWKCDPEIARLDATLPLQLTFSQFQALQIYQLPLTDWASRSFAIDTLQGEHIGNCMYYNLDRYARSVEIGIIIGERAYWNQGYGTEALQVLVHHLFEELQLRRICLHTLEWNLRAQRSFEKCGFASATKHQRDGYVFLVMELHRYDWLRTTSSDSPDGDSEGS